jgi:filamentous hemagglutinin
MNKQRYRIVFNRARGLLMAVQETARTGGKSASGEGASPPGSVSQPPSVARSPSAMSLVAWAALWTASALAMVSAPAWAQNKVKVGSGAGAGTTMSALAGSPAVNAGGGLIANPKAAADRKPIVDAAGNGVPLVHIAPPSKGGVSRNEFTEFNVDERGLILNNSATSVQTQLGGWIGGNPQLGYVPARLILNEVTGTGKSVLKGVIEVAGRKADVVIANPNGLLCDGCGFINTSRATLSTGTPVFNSAGSLSGFDVRQGQINVGAGGLDASTLQQLDLIARGIVIEGQVWAQNLNLVAGANQVVYGSLGDVPQLEAQTSSATGAAPTFAIDLRELGALYAQNIYLIATEKGVGVNSTGRMVALEGSLQLSAAGDLSVKDVYARDAVLLASAGNMSLTGQIQTPTTTDGGHVADIRLTAAGALDNSGTVDAAGVLVVQAGSVNNQGNLIQRDSGSTANVRSEGAFNNSGVIYSAGDLAVSGQTVSDDHGTFLAEGRLDVSGPQVFLHGTQMAAGNDLAVAATAGELNATATQITAGGQVRLEAATQLSQVEGVLQAQSGVALRGANISNRDSTVLAGQSLSVQAAEALDNTGGELMGGGDVSLSADHFVNDASATRAAWIVSEGAVNLAAAHGVSNQAGVISGKTALNLEVGQGVLNNLQGTIVSDGQLDIRAAAVVNVAGQMVAGSVSGGTLNLTANELDNRQGNVSAGGAAVLNVRDGLINQSGVILSGTAEGAAEAALSIHAGSLQNTGGQVVGRDSLRLDTGALNNDLGVLASSLGELNLNAAEVGNAGGLISAATNATLTTRALDNTGGVISAAADLHLTSSAGVDNHAGIIVAQGVVDVTAGAALRNDAGQIVSNGGNVRLAAAQLSNDAGLVGAALDAALISDAGLSNAGGQILAGNAVSVWATGLDNQGGAMKAGGALSVTAADVDNTQGTLFSQQVTRVSAAGDVNNAGGEISAARSSSLAGVGDVVVQAGGQFSNRGGLLVAEGALALTAAQVDNTDGSTVGSDGVSVSSHGLINDRGSVASGADLSIRADALTNLDGAQVLAGGVLSVQGLQGAGTAIENHAATLSGHESVSVVAQSLNNDGGRLDSAGTVDVAVLQGGVLSNRLGVLTSTGGTHIQAQALDNAGGELSSAATVEVDTAGQTLANHGGRILAGSDLTVRAGALENIAGGLLVSQTGSVSVHAQQIDNGASTLSAGTDVSILGAQKVSNQGGSMVAGHSVQVSASLVDNTAGAMAGNTGQVSLQADVVTNAQGLISGAQRVDVVSATERLVNDGGQILSDTAVSLSGHGISNVAGKLAADTVHVDAGAGVLDNTQGQLVGGTSLVLDQRGLINSQGLVATGGALDIDTHGSTLDNAGGQVAAQGALNLQTGALNNEGGTLSSGQTVQIHSTQLNNDAGRVMAVGDVSLQTGAVTNRAGLLASTGAASKLTASVASLDNQDGQVSGADVRLESTGNVLNNGGSIAASRDLELTAESLTNGASALASGQVLAARDALLTVSTTVSNHASLIQGGRDTVVQAAALDNDGGLLESHGSLTTTVSGAASNVGGIVRTANESSSASNAGDLKFVAAQLDNTGGTLSSAANLTLDVQAGALRNVARCAHRGRRSGVRCCGGTHQPEQHPCGWRASGDRRSVAGCRG